MTAVTAFDHIRDVLKIFELNAKEERFNISDVALVELGKAYKTYYEVVKGSD